MKKVFEALELTILSLEDEDIITGSNGFPGDRDEDDGGNGGGVGDF